MSGYCTNCGSRFLEGAAFCTGCGSPVGGDEASHQEEWARRTASDRQVSAPPATAQQVVSAPGEPNPNADGPSHEAGSEGRGKRPVRTRIRTALAAPFVWMEKKIMEPFADWLRSLAFLDILEYVGKLGILVVVILWTLGVS